MDVQLDPGTSSCAKSWRFESNRLWFAFSISRSNSVPVCVQSVLKLLELVEEVHQDGPEPLSVDVRDGGHLQVDLDVIISLQLLIPGTILEDFEL